jgi:protein-S-isoprenylcysteine O-methyltransferase Ste14
MADQSAFQKWLGIQAKLDHLFQQSPAGSDFFFTTVPLVESFWSDSQGAPNEAARSIMAKMPLFTIQRQKLIGSVLVALQFGLLILQAAVAAPRILQGILPVGALLVAGTALALAVWTLLHNRLGNFNIHPTPKVSGVLVTKGPYRWIRHPMYTSLLLGAGALASMSSPVTGWLAWSALAVVLLLKSTFEERWLCEHYPDYAAYRLVSKRFVPWLF